MKTILTHCNIISDGDILYDSCIVCNNNLIENIFDHTVSASQNDVVLDMHHNYVSPGLIDLQIMGAGGYLFGSLPSIKALEVLEREMMKQGTTGFLPTVSTNSDEIVNTAISCAKEYKGIGNFLGLHLEGPYINKLKKGAHPEQYIRTACLDEVRAMVENSGNTIRIVTLAPEVQPYEVIDYLTSQNIVVSMGHSAATYDEAMTFLSGKKKCVTHLYNAMTAINHRQPGMVPAIFRKQPYTGIVADGIHVAFPMVRLAKELLGNSLFLVSDGATPTTEGVYKHTLKGDRYVTPGVNGAPDTLSGSALTMMKAVSNCVKHIGISLPEAINMASLYPARVLGIDTKVGLIKEGYTANIISFTPDFAITDVVFNGKIQAQNQL